MRIWVLAAAGLSLLGGQAVAQDAALGEASFKRLCAPCHDIGPAAKVKLGPPINGLDGRTAGTIPNFKYSEANQTSGIVWGDASFAEYIKNPQQKMPGTRMAFAGMRDDKEIANLWAFLKQFGEDGSKK